MVITDIEYFQNKLDNLKSGIDNCPKEIKKLSKQIELLKELDNDDLERRNDREIKK